MITYKVQRVTEPDIEPITLVKAKEHLRIESDFALDDDLICAYIGAARDQSEKYCNRSFALADFFLMITGFPGTTAAITLPDPKTAEVTAITYIDDSNTEQTVDPGDYVVDIDRQQIRPTGNWPIRGKSLKISYSAGYDASASPAETIPKSVDQAMLLIIADMYELRQSQIVGNMISENPAASMRLSLHRVEMGV